MQTHQDMKESGVAWLGDIPTSWGLKRAKYIFRKTQEKPSTDDKVVTAFRDGEVVLRSLRREDGFTFADKEIGYQHVQVGDLVIHAMDAFAGAIGVSKSEGKMSPVCSICKPVSSDINTHYYAYLLRTMTKTNYLVAIAKGIRERSTDFRYSDFGKMHLPLPSFEVQCKIVSYIDKETAKIDDLIAKEERLLALLEEKRRATITHAVTRGLDPNTELKETSIPWLSKIPTEWSVINIKNAFDIINGSTPKSGHDEYWDGEIVWVTPSDLSKLKGKTVSASKRVISVRGLASCGASLIPKETIILSSRAPIGSLAIAGRELSTNQGCKSLVPKYKINSTYYYYLLLALVPILNMLGRGTTFLEISGEELSRLKIPRPDIESQRKIADYLDEHDKKTDSLKEKIKTQITLLHERRASLISHAVTGKIKV